MRSRRVPIIPSTSWTLSWYSAFKAFHAERAALPVCQHTRNKAPFHCLANVAMNSHIELSMACVLPGFWGHGSFSSWSTDSRPASSWIMSTTTHSCLNKCFCFRLQSYTNKQAKASIFHSWIYLCNVKYFIRSTTVIVATIKPWQLGICYQCYQN